MWRHVFPTAPGRDPTAQPRTAREFGRGRRHVSSPSGHAGAAGAESSGTGVAGGVAGRVPPVFHRPHVRRVLRAGLRVRGPDRAANGVRDACRGEAVAGVEPSSGAPVLLGRPLVARAAHCGACPAAGAPARVRRAGGEGRDRRHAVSPPRAEGARRVLVPRRVRHRRTQGRLRQTTG